MTVAVWVPDICPEHGGEARLLPSGEPACYGCRLQKVATERAMVRAAERARSLARLGVGAVFDHRMRAAGDRSLLDDLDETA